MIGWGAIRQGIADEDTVAEWLAGLGYEATPFGQRVWDPTTCDLGRPEIIAAVRRTERWPLRHAPDLLVAKGGHTALVEVFRNRYEDRRCMEISKLLALDVWAQVNPVVLVDVGHRTAWVHETMWAGWAVSDVSRYTNRGSGDAYAWFSRANERPLEAVFR